MGTNSAKGMVGVGSVFEPNEGEITKNNIDEGKMCFKKHLTGNKVAQGSR